MVYVFTDEQLRRVSVVHAKDAGARVPYGTDRSGVIIGGVSLNTPNYIRSSVQLGHGRRVGLRNPSEYGYAPSNALRGYASGLGAVDLEWAALERTPVAVGDKVFLTTGRMAGFEATAVTVEGADGVLFSLDYFGRTTQVTRRTWLKITDEGWPAEAVAWVESQTGGSVGDSVSDAADEDLMISEWWVKRIKATAAAAKTKYGMCSSIDSVLRELFEPVLIRASIREEDGGFAVYTGGGEKVSWYKEQSRAESERKSLDKKISIDNIDPALISRKADA